MHRLSGDDSVYVSTGQRPSASRTQHGHFPGARERETRRRLSACARVAYGAYFQVRILTLLSPTVMTTNNSAK